VHAHRTTIAAFLGLACVTLAGCRLPSDESLARSLEEKRPALEALMRLCDEDKTTRAWDDGHQFESTKMIFSDRAKQYADLFKQADIKSIWRTSEGITLFFVGRIGMAGHIAAVGYAYSKGAPQVSSRAGQPRVVYRPVKDDWYTFRGKF
jgi:hypothetical protein